MRPPPSRLSPLRLAVALGYSSFVLALLLTPLAPVSALSLPPWSDKAVHLGLFGLLAPAWLFVYGKAAMVPIVLLSIAAAGGTEVVQGWIPSRSTDLVDFLVGGVGVVLGATGWLALSPRRH